MQTNNKLREALEELVANIEMRASVFDIFSIIDRKTFLDAKAALAEPVRNGEVGSAEEQSERFHAFCEEHKDNDAECLYCPLLGQTGGHCELAWAQLQYEGGAK